MRIQQPFRQAHSSPATSPYTGEALIRRLPRESTYNKERPLRRERPKYNFLFLILPGDAPEGVTLSRKSFSAKNLSARSVLFHRADRIGRELTRPPHYNKRRYACMPCGYKWGPAAQGDPARGRNFRKGVRLPGDAPEGVTLSRKSFSAKNLSARSALFHRADRIGHELTRPPHYNKRRYAQMGARSAGRPCLRKKFQKGRPLTGRRTRGRCRRRRSP